MTTDSIEQLRASLRERLLALSREYDSAYEAAATEGLKQISEAIAANGYILCPECHGFGRTTSLDAKFGKDAATAEVMATRNRDAVI